MRSTGRWVRALTQSICYEELAKLFLWISSMFVGSATHGSGSSDKPGMLRGPWSEYLKKITIETGEPSCWKHKFLELCIFILITTYELPYDKNNFRTVMWMLTLYCAIWILQFFIRRFPSTLKVGKITAFAKLGAFICHVRLEFWSLTKKGLAQLKTCTACTTTVRKMIVVKKHDQLGHHHWKFDWLSKFYQHIMVQRKINKLHCERLKIPTQNSCNEFFLRYAVDVFIKLRPASCIWQPIRACTMVLS